MGKKTKSSYNKVAKTFVPIAQLTIQMELFFNVLVFCYLRIASYLAMTVSMYRHCEEERRSNPVKYNFLNRLSSLVIIHAIISRMNCATGAFVFACTR